MVGVILGFIGSPMAHAEEIKKLAEEVQNPVSDLVRVGFNNGTFLERGIMTMFLISSILRPPPQENLATGHFSTDLLFLFPTYRPVP